MDESPQFPSDVNGDVFRLMIRDGVDITQAREMDFCHIFRERRQALAFADIVDGRDLKVCISYYEERDMWQVIVNRNMIPTYKDVTAFELTLASQAESVGGE